MGTRVRETMNASKQAGKQESGNAAELELVSVNAGEWEHRQARTK